MNLDAWDGLMIGIYIGVFIGWLWNRKAPAITANLNIDRDLAKSIAAKMEQEGVFRWLDDRGLTWMAKGAVFDSDRKVDK